jgi:argininosuccinate synthase
LLYGSAYIYAFFDPFEKIDHLNFKVITQRYPNEKRMDNALAEELSRNTDEIYLGDVKLKTKFKSIYSRGRKKDQEVYKDNYVTIKINPEFNTIIANGLVDAINSIPFPQQVIKEMKEKGTVE